MVGKKEQKLKQIQEVLSKLLLKVAQLEDPHITKLESSHRTKLIIEASLELLRLDGYNGNRTRTRRRTNKS